MREHMIKYILTISIFVAGAVGLQAQNNPLSAEAKRFYEGTRNNLMRGPGGPSTAEVVERAVEQALGLS